MPEALGPGALGVGCRPPPSPLGDEPPGQRVLVHSTTPGCGKRWGTVSRWLRGFKVPSIADPLAESPSVPMHSVLCHARGTAQTGPLPAPVLSTARAR